MNILRIWIRHLKMRLKKKFTTLIFSSKSSRQIVGSEMNVATAQKSRAAREALLTQRGKTAVYYSHPGSPVMRTTMVN